jgi:enoyl-CoA hydratase/carnithine racemase
VRLLDSAALARVTARDVEAIAAGEELTLVIVSGALRGEAAAAALFSDFFVAEERAVLHLDCPAAWAGAIRRIGRGAFRLHLTSLLPLTAEAAMSHGLCDALVPDRTDPVEWAADWVAGRSALALESAAALIRRRGGDPLERAEFARLFAAGEPQEGLAAFLGKRQPNWRKWTAGES